MVSDTSFWKDISRCWNRLIDDQYQQKAKEFDESITIEKPNEGLMNDDLDAYGDDDD